MLELLASKGAASFLGGLGSALGGGGGPNVSGAPVDARSFMDGSGWVVSTGSSKATGGNREQAESFGESSAAMPGEAPALAGFSGWAGVLLLLVFAGAVMKAKQ